MTRIAAILVLAVLVAPGAARAGGENKVSWMRFDAAQQISAATGKPILAYAGFT